MMICLILFYCVVCLCFVFFCGNALGNGLVRGNTLGHYLWELEERGKG